MWTSIATENSCRLTTGRRDRTYFSIIIINTVNNELLEPRFDETLAQRMCLKVRGISEPSPHRFFQVVEK